MRTSKHFTTTAWIAVIVCAGFTGAVTSLGSEDEGDMDSKATLTIRAREAPSGVPVSCRMKLAVPGTETVFRPEGAYDYRGAWTSSGESRLEVPIPAAEMLEVELTVSRGLEYQPVTKRITLKPGDTKEEVVELRRWAEMRRRGWWSGDLHAHRPVDQMGAILVAEDLNLAPVLTVWNTRNEWREQPLPDELVVNVDAEHAYHVLSLEDERGGGALMFFNLNRVPYEMADDARWWPCAVSREPLAREAGAWVEAEKPFWWEVPIWMALADVDSLGLVSNHFTAERTWDDEVWGRHRDLKEYPGTLGFAQSLCDIYYHYLNLGFRLPPTAGAASGVLPNEIGGNRTYVHLGDRFSYQDWWKGLKSGRCFSTNGPMLLASVGEQLPGAELTPSDQTPLSVEVQSSRGVRSLEIVVDGKVVERMELNSEPGTLRRTVSVDTRQAAWLAVRCFETETGNIRYAHTGPFYIKGMERAKTYRDDAAFFTKWIDDLKAQDWQDPERGLTDEQREQLMELYDRARAFYAEL